MSISVIRGTNDKPVASRMLAEKAAEWKDWSGKLFIGYPIVAGTGGPHRVDALLVSSERGLVVFDLVEGSDLGDFRARQDEAFNLLDAKLRTEPGLTQRRDLRVPIHTVSFAPAAGRDTRQTDNQDYALADLERLTEVVGRMVWTDADSQAFDLALSTLEHIRTIRRKGSGKRRAECQPESRGAKLRSLEDPVATLDKMQSRAVIETIDGVQRIRGLAGSGKTIVLALKAAYLHSQHPGWRIAVTFHTRSLKGFFRRLIGEFCVSQTNESPDWSMLRVVNAWGGAGGPESDGIYHEFCETRGRPYYHFQAARTRYGQGQEFKGACEEALQGIRGDERPQYDAILVDEAQDLPPAFLRICYAFLTEEKRLVYAYDELQNLSGAPLPSPRSVFGEDARWSEDAPGADVILEKCYRNSRPVLTTAHALGFGIYRGSDPGGSCGVLQMFDDPRLWEDVGYRPGGGQLRAGSHVTLRRTDDTSPGFLEAHSPVDDLLRFQRFDDAQQQSERVARAIHRNLAHDQLQHDDILVINPNPRTARSKLGPIRAQLLDLGIRSHLAGVDAHRDVFFQAGSVVFSGIHRAKGNEAAMVYIVNAQDCWYSPFNLASIRNRLFAAITRSKAWVRVCGTGDGMARLVEEYETLKGNHFELRFRYPTEQELAKMRIVHRDMTAAQGKLVGGHQSYLTKLADDLEAGRVYAEDLEDVTPRLRKLFVVKEGPSGE